MGQPQRAWRLLKHTADPSVRSYLIHRLSPLGAPASALVKQLDEEPDVTIRRALLLSLGEFDDKDWTAGAPSRLVDKLRHLYHTAEDAGLHAAAEWLLRHWKEEAWLKEANQALAGDKQQRLKRLEEIKHELKKEKRKPEPRWYVNGQGQTLVVIPGPVEFWMGSPIGEEGREGGPEGKIELRHWRRIGRSFAIAAKEVTVEQFRRFRDNHTYNKVYSPSPDCPVPIIRMYAFRGGGVIFNWENNPRELRIGRPDGTDERGNGSQTTARVDSLDPNTWYTLRWRITAEGMQISINDKVVFAEEGKYDLLAKRGSVRVHAVNSIVDVRSFFVMPVASGHQRVVEAHPAVMPQFQSRLR